MKPVLSGIYFLFKGQEVVYIGQSSDIYRRISEHRLGVPKRKGPPKDFDRWEYYEIEDEDKRDAVEYFLINLLKPRLNVDYFARGKAIKASEELHRRIDEVETAERLYDVLFPLPKDPAMATAIRIDRELLGAEGRNRMIPMIKAQVGDAL